MHNFCFILKPKLLIKMNYRPQKFGAKVKTRVIVAKSSFGPKAKMTDFPPNIFPTFFQLFVNFLIHFHVLCNIWKIWRILFPFGQDIADFHFQHGQKWKILTQTIKAKLFFYEKWMILLLWFGSKFFIFDHADSENLRYLAETKKRCAKFFICCKVHENVSENH